MMVLWTRFLLQLLRATWAAENRRYNPTSMSRTNRRTLLNYVATQKEKKIAMILNGVFDYKNNLLDYLLTA
jgi:hypothetical protein